MNRQAILHIPMSQYAHGIDEEHIVFRLRAARDDLKSCVLYYGDRACQKSPVEFLKMEMQKAASDLLFDWFEVRLSCPFKRVCYYFELSGRQGARILYYGDQFEERPADDRSDYFQLPYNHRADRADVPEWMRDAIVYNIFPDSFATGRRHISKVPSEKRHDGEICRSRLGGTLRGVTENLDYIAGLGCDCLYLNPIFAAGEYHKYDLMDYHHIDPCFGTDDDFRELVQKAHARDMRVVIDGVFNHCGWRFFAFRDAVKNGRRSSFWPWFHRLCEAVQIPEQPGTCPGYECFGYERMMPKLATDHPAVIAYFCEVGAYWVREFDIDGWRLDVASEVCDVFWRAFRRAVKEVKPDCALIGEVWESAPHWLDGSMFDSTMNYDFRRHLKRFFADGSISAAAFDARVTDMLMRYRLPYAYSQLNLLDSHDVSRFFSLCGGDERKLRLAVLFQMTFIGMPCVLYGDERGLAGVEEKDYRSPMPWEADETSLTVFYRQAAGLRRAERTLRRGRYKTVVAEDGGGFYLFSRYDDTDRILIAMNRGETEKPVAARNILWQSGFENGILKPYGFIVYRE